MNEQEHNKVNILGIPVTAMGPEEAAGLSLELMRSKEIHSVFFLTAGSSLYGQADPEAADIIRDCTLIISGDKHIEETVFSDGGTMEREPGTMEYVDYYLNELFYWLEKEKRFIYMVCENESQWETVGKYLKDNYPNIRADGLIYKDYDNTVNEINAVIPDILILCLPSEQQLVFLRDYVAMMNTKLVLLMDEAYFMKDGEAEPPLIQALHLEKIYHWIKKDQTHQNTVMASLFKSKMAEANQGQPESEDISEIVQNDEDSVD